MHILLEKMTRYKLTVSCQHKNLLISICSAYYLYKHKNKQDKQKHNHIHQHRLANRRTILLGIILLRHIFACQAPDKTHRIGADRAETFVNFAPHLAQTVTYSTADMRSPANQANQRLAIEPIEIQRQKIVRLHMRQIQHKRNHRRYQNLDILRHMIDRIRMIYAS